MIWVVHDEAMIGKCEVCGEHHFHIVRVGRQLYLQCGKCSEMTMIHAHEKKKEE